MARTALPDRVLRLLRRIAAASRGDAQTLARVTKKLQQSEAKREQLKDELMATKRRHKRLQHEIRNLAQYDYGSLTPGVPGWADRWLERPGKRVLLFADKDFSGSFMKWAHALNDHSDYAARLVQLKSHEFGYASDLVYLPFLVDESDRLSELALQADVIHVKDETGFYLGTNGIRSDIFTELGKPMIFTHYGGYARKHVDDPAYRAFVQTFDARVAMTPDLNFDWFDGYFIPHSIDTIRYEYCWQDGRRLAHSPSTAERKGTEALLEAVAGLDVEFDLIQGVPHDECVARKALSNLFFDQAGRERAGKMGTDRVIGWYGNSALEAAVFGIPTFAHLSEAAFEGAIRAGKDIRSRCGILNTPMDAAGMRERIAAFLGLSSDERRAVSLRTRAWVEEFHSYDVNGRELAEMYDAVIASAGGRAGQPSGDSPRRTLAARAADH